VSPQVQVREFELGNGAKYLCHPHHRNGNPNKSQWDLSEQRELDLFGLAFENQWLLDSVGWGVAKMNNTLEYLGVSTDRLTRLFIAKFVATGTNWHGYPADHQRNQQDIPATAIQRKWLDDRVVPPSKIRKISKGQPCSL